MFRCRSLLLAIPTLILVLALSGCLGGSSPNSGGGIKSVSLSPSGNASMEVGATQTFTASALDANNKPVIGTDIQFLVSSPPGSTTPPPLSITSTGAACAGTWDATQSLCSPGNPGIAIVTALANGVSSTAQATVYVHNHIASLQLSQAQTQAPVYDCFSQGQTWLYKATAFDSNGDDITATIGQPSWTLTNIGVVTANANPPLQNPLPLNQVQITAAVPGITNLFATISGATSNSMPITTCLVRSIRLQVSGTTANSVSVSSGGSATLQATVLDTLGATVTKPPLTWITSNPEVASFGTAASSSGTNTLSAHAISGGAVVSAACVPPSCNVGVLPNINVPTITPPYSEPDPTAMPAYVFASDGPVSPTDNLQAYGALSVAVTNSSSTTPTYTAWTATDLCGDTTNGCSSVMFSVTAPLTTGNNPIGTVVPVPRTPNSMMFNHQSRIYMGSDQGLMYYDVGGTGSKVTLVSPVSTPCNVALCGKVLTISNDGKQVVVADTVSATPQAYIYNAGSNSGAVTDLVLPAVATAAAFSPDESKIFLLAQNGQMYVYSTVNALGTVTLPSAAASGSDVAFSADGSFAYVAGSSGSTGAVAAYSTCALYGEPSTQIGPTPTSPITVSTLGVPYKILPAPAVVHDDQTDPGVITQNIYVFEPPNIQVLTAQFNQNVLPPLKQPTQYQCNVPTLDTFGVTANYTLNGGNFTPVYAELVNNGSELIVVARFIPSVYIFSNGSTRSIPLQGSYDPRWASASDDGNYVFVAACDQYQNNNPVPPSPCIAGSLHVVTTTGTGFDQKVPYINNTTDNMCNDLGAQATYCFPDLVAVKPH
jgi:hypothetical protein